MATIKINRCILHHALLYMSNTPITQLSIQQISKYFGYFKSLDTVILILFLNLVISYDIIQTNHNEFYPQHVLKSYLRKK